MLRRSYHQLLSNSNKQYSAANSTNKAKGKKKDTISTKSLIQFTKKATPLAFLLYFAAYQGYYTFFYKSAIYDFCRRHYFYKVRKNLYYGSDPESNPEFLEEAALMERELFFRRMTTYDSPLPSFSYEVFRSPFDPLVKQYNSLRPSLVLHHRDRDSSNSKGSETSTASTATTTTLNGQLLEGPKSFMDLIPLPWIIFGEKAQRNRLYRNAISSYVSLEGKKLDLNLSPKKVTVVTSADEKNHRPPRKPTIDSIIEFDTTDQNSSSSKITKSALTFSSTKTTRDRVLENTLVWNHPWLLSSETERVALDFYSGRFLMKQQEHRMATSTNTKDDDSNKNEKMTKSSSSSLAINLPRPLASFAQHYFFEYFFADYITKMRICFLQRSMKSATQIWHLKGTTEVSIDNIFMMNERGKRKIEQLSERESAPVQAPRWSFDGYSRLKALLFIRKTLYDIDAKSRQEENKINGKSHDNNNNNTKTANPLLQYDRETMNLVLDRALVYAQCRIGNHDLKTKSKSSSEKEDSKTWYKKMLDHYLPEPRVYQLWGDRWSENVKTKSGNMILDSICHRLKRGEVIPVATGTGTHSISMLLAPNFIAVSNRGSGTGGRDRFGFSVYSIQNTVTRKKNHKNADDNSSNKNVTYFEDALANKDGDARRMLSKIVLGGLRKDDLIPSPTSPTTKPSDADDKSSQSPSSSSLSSTKAKDHDNGNNSRDIPHFLAKMIPNNDDVSLAGVVQMRKQISGDCSFESSAKPLMHFGLALSLARKNSPQQNMINTASSDEDIESKNNYYTSQTPPTTTIPAPLNAESFIHLLRQSSPRYFRLAASIKYHHLLEYLNHQREKFPKTAILGTSASSSSSLLSPRYLLRNPDPKAHQLILDGFLKQMSSRISNLTPDEASTVVDALLIAIDEQSGSGKQQEEQPEEVAAASIATLQTKKELVQLLHFAAMCGSAVKVKEIIEKLRGGGNGSATMMEKHLEHDISLLKPSKKSLNRSVFEAVEHVEDLRRKGGGIFMYGVSPVPFLGPMKECVKLVA